MNYYTYSYDHESVTIRITGATVGGYLRVFLRLYNDTSDVTVDTAFLVTATSFNKTFSGLAPETHYIYRVGTCTNSSGSGTDWGDGAAIDFTTDSAPEPYKCYLYLTDNGSAVEGVSSVSVYSYTDGTTYRCTAGNDLTITDQTDMLRFTATVATGYVFSHWEYRIDSGTATAYTSESNPFYYDGTGTARIYIKPRVQKTRPDDWTWSSYITSDANVNLTASEWNGFCTRINEFRIYSGLGQYSFTSVTSGVTDISAAICNQAWTAINAITGHGTMPSKAVSGGDLYASFFTGLKTALNAVP